MMDVMAEGNFELNCPCCGAGGMNYTVKLNRKK